MNDEIRIIGKSNNLYIATYDKTATIFDYLKEGFLVDNTGRVITQNMPINCFLRERKWEELNLKYSDVIPEANFEQIFKTSIKGYLIGKNIGLICNSKDVTKFDSIKFSMEEINNLSFNIDDELLNNILNCSLSCVENDLSLDKTYEIVQKFFSTSCNEISQMCITIYLMLFKYCVKYKNIAIAMSNVCNEKYENLFHDETIEKCSAFIKSDILYLKKDDTKDIVESISILKSIYYSVIHGFDFETTIKESVKLGNNINIVSSLSGFIASVVYGIDDIPKEWLNLIKEDLSEQLLQKYNIEL